MTRNDFIIDWVLMGLIAILMAAPIAVASKWVF